MRSVERGICPIVKSTKTELFLTMIILHIFHCSCATGPYFYFRFKIWRHCRVHRPRFPIRCGNFGDSRTFKADIGLFNICMGFQDLLAYSGIGGWRKGWYDVDPHWARERTLFATEIETKKHQTVQNFTCVAGCQKGYNSLLISGVLTSLLILVKVDQEMRPWECGLRIAMGQ